MGLLIKLSGKMAIGRDLSFIFRSLFLLRRAKKQLRRLWEEVERSVETERSIDEAPPRGLPITYSAVAKRKRRLPVGRGVVVAKWRLGVERSGNEV